MFAAGAVVSWQRFRRNAQCAADGAKVIGQILEAHDVINIGERILFVMIQPQIVCNRYSLGNYPPKFLLVPIFWSLRRREIIRHHSVPRVSHAGEFIEAAKLLVSQGVAIFRKRRVFLDVVVWIAQSETLDPVLLLT